MMRYLVHSEFKEKTLYFWEDPDMTHTAFAYENAICLEEVSSVGYILYNPEEQRWLLTGTISWNGNANLPEDKQKIFQYIQKHFDNDNELKKRLSDKWILTQKKNAEIIKRHPLFARLIKAFEKGRE